MATPKNSSGQNPTPPRKRPRAEQKSSAGRKSSVNQKTKIKNQGQAHKHRRRSISLLGWIASITMMFGVIGLTCASTGLYYITRDLPNLDKLRIPARPPSITVVSSHGEIMGRRGAVHAGLVSYDEIPDHLIQAVIAIEDQRFFKHIGIDFRGLARAAWANYKAGKVVQGGSTLTQQLAKNLFLNPERTYIRKLQEVILAIRLEQEFTKQDIIQLYLNRVYFGAGNYGIEAAAERYFEKSARNLTLSESAILAGLLKAPSRYAPTTNKDRAVGRAQVVLNNMEKAGFVSQKEQFFASQMLRMPRNQAETFETAAYVLDYVTEILPDVIGEPRGDLVVETTLDLELQRLAEKTVTTLIGKHGKEKKVEQAGAVLMTNNGAVKALVGGLDYNTSQFNRVTKGLRQPGSTFKTFVYLAALEYGMLPNDIRVDQPIQIGDWEPKNYSNSYRGVVTIDEALTRSINTVAAQVASEIGTRAVIDVAKRLGIKQDLPNSPSIALGTGEVTLYELTGAFANLASGGKRVRSHIITRVLTSDGRILFEYNPGPDTQVINPTQVADMNLMLGHVVSSGTGRRAQLSGHQAAGKTGTTQDYRDAWFIGYTGHFTAGVWVGNDDNSKMNRVTGGNLPTIIWKEIMQKVHERLHPIALPQSQPTIVQRINPQALGVGSFFNRLFGFGQPTQRIDPRERSEQYGYRHHPNGEVYPKTGIDPPYDSPQYQQHDVPQVITGTPRIRKPKQQRSRLILGGRPVDSQR
jgi:penicillin-binding protein 1A